MACPRTVYGGSQPSLQPAFVLAPLASLAEARSSSSNDVAMPAEILRVVVQQARMAQPQMI